jgi:hypothetical protein
MTPSWLACHRGAAVCCEGPVRVLWMLCKLCVVDVDAGTWQARRRPLHWVCSLVFLAAPVAALTTSCCTTAGIALCDPASMLTAPAAAWRHDLVCWLHVTACSPAIHPHTATHHRSHTHSSQGIPACRSINSCAGTLNMRATPQQPAHTAHTPVAVPYSLSSVHAATCAPTHRTTAPCLSSSTPCTATAPTPVHLLHCCADTSSAGALAATHQHQPCTHAGAVLLLSSLHATTCAPNPLQTSPQPFTSTPCTATAPTPVHYAAVLPRTQIHTTRQPAHTLIQPSLFIQGRLVVLRNTILGSGEQSSSGEVLA